MCDRLSFLYYKSSKKHDTERGWGPGVYLGFSWPALYNVGKIYGTLKVSAILHKIVRNSNRDLSMISGQETLARHLAPN